MKINVFETENELLDRTIIQDLREVTLTLAKRQDHLAPSPEEAKEHLYLRYLLRTMLAAEHTSLILSQINNERLAQAAETEEGS